MKPAFALSLSFEGISLLHRAAGGWRRVGGAPLDAPDLAGALSTLRDKALLLEPQVSCKLIIPNDQIKYLTVETGTLDEHARREAVEAALDGTTPYTIEELAYDISPDGTVTHVAAVARETLDEAEAFAREHGFEALSYVAVPDDNPFLGEPFFGPSPAVADRTGSAAVEPDGIAVVVIGDAEIPDRQPQAVGHESLPDPESDPDFATDPEPQPDPAAEPPKTDPSPESASAAPVIGFASRRGKPDGPDTAPPIVSTPKDTTSDATAPKVAPKPNTAAKPAEPQTEAARATPAPDVAKPAAKRGAPVSAPDLDLPEAPAGDERPTEKPADRPAVTRPAPPPPLAQAHPVADPVPASAAFAVARDPASEAERLTIFGARQSNGGVGGKPRFMGLALSIALLIFLAGVAAWAALFLEDGVTGLFRSAPEDTEIAAGENPEPPATETAQAQPSAASPDEPEAPATPAPEVLASLPQEETLSETDGAVLDALRMEPRVVEEAPTDPEEAADAAPADEALYAATGIWPNAPAVPEVPGIISLDDVYIASIDRRDLSQDAVALTPAQEFDTDVQMAALAAPSAAGADFELDSRGLVTPTPDGTLNPDGVMIHAGPPPVVPPATPVRFEEPPEIDEARERLAGMRPRLRPDALVEQNERFQLGGRTREELAGVRPRLRPESLQEQVEQAQPETAAPTENTVAVSAPPKVRPEDLDTEVEEGADETGSFAARTVKPAAPSSKSVSRQATMNNAINLRKVNLIGVYGTPSNRRALIRLPSGRYKKVKVGDRVDGGRVVAIGDSELRYQKGGRNMTLTIPSG